MPRGVPVGGLFQQATHHAAGGEGEELSADTIAMDPSSLVPIADGLPAVAVAPHRGRRTPAADPTVESLFSFDMTRSAPFGSTGPGPIEMPGGTRCERAELPGLPTPEPTGEPIPRAPNEDGADNEAKSSGRMRDRNAGEGASAGTRRGDYRGMVQVAIYCAASLLLGIAVSEVSATSRRSGGAGSANRWAISTVGTRVRRRECPMFLRLPNCDQSSELRSVRQAKPRIRGRRPGRFRRHAT